MFAGAASLISHSIPKQWLLHLDKLGILVVLSKVVREYKTVINHPELLGVAAGAAVMNGIDAYCARNKGYTLPHVLWHFSSAYAAYLFLSKVDKK